MSTNILTLHALAGHLNEYWERSLINKEKLGPLNLWLHNEVLKIDPENPDQELLKASNDVDVIKIIYSKYLDQHNLM